jgi:UPF0288 family protein (methanogenesis marker protein 3)
MEMGEQKTTLRDLINYEAASYINDNDIALIQSTFKDNPRLLRVLRKVLLPSIGDIELPIEEIGKDVWLTLTDWQQVPDDQVKPLVLARQEAIKFIAGGLIQLKVIAQAEEKTIADMQQRRKRDSAK